MEKTSFLKSASPLFLILFIDGMGLGLVIPILNGLLFDPQSTFLARYTLSESAHNIIYGSIIGIFMLCWFFGAAILGDLSDKIGRKKSLLICLIGAFLSYVLSAIAVSFSSIGLMLLGRMIAGFTSGSQPIAQAAIIDLSEPEDRARNIGYILLSLSLGFIVGPLFGGILSDNHLVSLFNFSTPFYFAGLVSGLNILLLMAIFHETFVSKPTTFAINPYQAIHIFIAAFQHKSIRKLSIILFIFIFGWSSYYSFISLYLLKVHGFTPTQVSLFMAVMGIGFGIGNGFLTNFFARLFTLRNNLLWSIVIASVCTGLTFVFTSNLFNWLIVAPLACAISVAYASLLTLFSTQVDKDSQGWVMGITGSVMAFVWAINGISVGILATWSAALPIAISFVSLVITVIAAYFLCGKNQDTSKNTEIVIH